MPHKVSTVDLLDEASPTVRIANACNAVQARGCRFQIGSDMLFEPIPAYLEFFGFPTTTPDDLRAVATLKH